MAQQVHEGVIEAIGISISNKATLGGAFAGFLGWLAQVNWVGLSGVLIAVAGLAMNYYFQHKRDRREAAADAREAAESAARIEALRDQCSVEVRRP